MSPEHELIPEPKSRAVRKGGSSVSRFIGGMAICALLLFSFLLSIDCCYSKTQTVEDTLNIFRLKKASGGHGYGRAFLLANMAALAPSGRILLNTFSENSSDDYRFEAAVLLEYGDENDTFEWRGTVSQSDYEQANTRRLKLVKKYSRLALKALARRVGYYDKLYGNDESSVPETRLLRVTITDLQENETKVLYPN